MIAGGHKRAFRLSATILALVALGMLVAAPLLINHPHHSELAHNNHCAVCALSTVHATLASAPSNLLPDHSAVARVPLSDIALTSGSNPRSWDNRAPPSA